MQSNINLVTISQTINFKSKKYSTKKSKSKIDKNKKQSQIDPNANKSNQNNEIKNDIDFKTQRMLLVNNITNQQ